MKVRPNTQAQPLSTARLLLTLTLIPIQDAGGPSRAPADRIGAPGLGASVAPRPTESTQGTRQIDTAHYVLIRDGTVLARISTSTDHGGVVTVRSQFHPDTTRFIVTRLQHDAQAGTPTWLESRGVDERGSPHDESFSMVSGLATWRIGSYYGRKDSANGAIYLPAKHGRWEAILPRLLRVAGPALFLPFGRARLEREGSLVLRCRGVEERVTQYVAIGLTPVMSDRVWVDAAGRLFADAETVRAGCEDVLPALRDSAGAARAATDLRYARTLRRVPDRPVAIHHARLFDAATKAIIDSATVLVQDSTILAIGRDGVVAIPPDAELINARGRMLLPGLWDMHSHDYGDVPSEMLQLAGGVTTIRDMLRDTVIALRLTARPHDEVAFAPNVFWAGVLDGVGGRRGVVTTDSAARFLVRRYAELGARQIKLYGRLDPRLVPAAVEEARRLGLRVGGHLALGMSAEQAISAGYDEISHIPFLFAHSDSAYLGSALWQGIDNAAGLDLDSDSVQQLIDLFTTHDIAIDANLAFVEPSLRTSTLVVRRDVAPMLDGLPAAWGYTMVGWDMVLPHDSLLQTAVDGFAKLRAFVRMLHAAGVRLLPGTDFLPGFTLHRELELYVEAGIAPADVLYLATLGAARLMGVDATRGSIEVGKRADMILVNGDPLRDMRDIRRVVMTMKGGAVYDPVVLYRTLSFEPCCPGWLP